MVMSETVVRSLFKYCICTINIYGFSHLQVKTYHTFPTIIFSFVVNKGQFSG